MAEYWIRGVLIAGAALMAAACSTYPTEPRYSTRADGVSPRPYASQPAYPTQPTYPAEPPAPVESPPPLTAPIGSIEGGALPSPSSPYAPAPTQTSPAPASPAPATPAPVTSGPRPAAPSSSAVAGSRYVIQPGDTLSGVGRRFRTPVQILIDLNALGPQGSIRSGQSILLPTTATDIGSDPYATGPAPVPVSAAEAPPPRPTSPQIPPPPPPPIASRPAAPIIAPPAVVPPAPRATTPAPPSTSSPGAPAFQWPVRGDILRRFGPVGLGERNHGINIGAPAGAPVVAAAAGRAAYVGDALPGLGLTVIIMHREGWRTVYSHLGSATVDDGDDVRAGQQVGTVGLTAGDGRPSMHFETRKMEGDNPTAVDPLTVLPR